MKKALLLVLPFILSSCGKSYYYHETYDGIYKLAKPNSIMGDAYYRSGFNLTNVDNANPVFRSHVLDYNATADTECDSPLGYGSFFSLCQWWAPEDMDFINADYQKDGNKHIYSNADRYFSVDIGDGEVELGLNAYNEYQKKYAGPRPRDANWSHHLIEEHLSEKFYTPIKGIFDENKDIYVSYDVTVDKCDFLGECWQEGDTAQLLCYLMINYCPIFPDGQRHRGGGFPQTIWFGLPVLDIRYPHTETYISTDSGQTAATNAFVYNLESSLYIEDVFKIGKHYSVDFAIKSYLKTAYDTAISRGYLDGTTWEDMCIGYISFGWEITGEYDCSCTMYNLDVYIA